MSQGLAPACPQEKNAHLDLDESQAETPGAPSKGDADADEVSLPGSDVEGSEDAQVEPEDSQCPALEDGLLEDDGPQIFGDEQIFGDDDDQPSTPPVEDCEPSSSLVEDHQPSTPVIEISDTPVKEQDGDDARRMIIAKDRGMNTRKDYEQKISEITSQLNNAKKLYASQCFGFFIQHIVLIVCVFVLIVLFCTINV